MIRNSILEKYNEKSKKELIKEEIYKEDGYYLLNNNRPISTRKISKLPKRKLNLLINEMLLSPKVNNLLYSTIAKKEAQRYKKENQLMSKKNSIIKQKRNKSCDLLSSIFKKRECLAEIEQINNDIETFKQNNKLEKTNLKKKNDIFWHSIQNHQSEQIGLYYKSINKTRLKNYGRTLDKCKSQSLKNDKFCLPSVKLDMNNVFSRLYHNEVYLKGKENQKEKRERKMSMDFSKDEEKELNKKKKTKKNQFRIKSVIDSGNGKEFTLKITKGMFCKCLLTNSGGPKNDYLRLTENLDKEDEKNKYILTLEMLLDDKGNTNLHSAVMENSIELVRYFLEKKLDPNVKNKNGNTALHIAMSNGNCEIIKMLLNANANLTIKNKELKTPLDLASDETRKKMELENEDNKGKSNYIF